MKKKLTIVLIVFIILFDTLVPNFIYAVDLGNFKDIMENFSQESAESILEKGEVTVTPSNGRGRLESIVPKPEDLLSVFTIDAICVTSLLSVKCVNIILTTIIYITQDSSKGLAEGILFNIDSEFTIEDLVLGKYTLFDINFFKNVDENSTNIVDTVKENVAIWYYTLRNIAIVISLLVLIYIGIRMAISTLATDKAKYKKMLTSWVVSFILLFIMQYIVIALVEIQEMILLIFRKLLESGETLHANGFEEVIIQETLLSYGSAKGWNKVPFVILYGMLVYYQVKFFLMYFKRFLSVGFLIIISPLVTITYSIDKVGDGRAQAYNAWFKQLFFSVFIQIVHAIIYIVFIYSAAEIARQIPLLGIIFLMALSRAEKVIKNTFSMKGKGFAEEKPLKPFKG